jgi:hypothetical protein
MEGAGGGGLSKALGDCYWRWRFEQHQKISYENLFDTKDRYENLLDPKDTKGDFFGGRINITPNIQTIAVDGRLRTIPTMVAVVLEAHIIII